MATTQPHVGTQQEIKFENITGTACDREATKLEALNSRCQEAIKRVVVMRSELGTKTNQLLGPEPKDDTAEVATPEPVQATYYAMQSSLEDLHVALASLESEVTRYVNSNL